MLYCFDGNCFWNCDFCTSKYSVGIPRVGIARVGIALVGIARVGIKRVGKTRASRMHDDPKMFLVAQLEKLKAARETGQDFPCLFDERNIESAFGIMDPTGRGYITNVQYQEGLDALGVAEHLSSSERVDQKSFVDEALLGLNKAAATYTDLTVDELREMYQKRSTSGDLLLDPSLIRTASSSTRRSALTESDVGPLYASKESAKLESSSHRSALEAESSVNTKSTVLSVPSGSGPGYEPDKPILERGSTV